MTNQNPNTGLLDALCVSGRPVEIEGKTFTVHELEAQMVGLLLLEMEAAANSGVAVISLLNPDSGEQNQYFKSSWWKIGAAAQDVVFTLIAFSLGEFERNEKGVPTANIERVRKLPVSYIVPLLKGIAEVNQSFFDGLRDGMETLTQKAPGLSSALNGMLGIQTPQSGESGEQPNQPEAVTDGPATSQHSSAAAGLS
jgi:hypothetical protein